MDFEYKQQLEALQAADLAAQLNQVAKVLTILSYFDPEKIAPDLKATFYSLRGEAYRLGGEYENSLQDLELAQQLFERMEPHPALRAELEQNRNRVGIVFYMQHHYLEAIKIHLKCLEAIITGAVNDPIFKAKICSNLANEYLLVGQTAEAIPMYEEAARIIKESENPLHLASIYSGLGLTYELEEDFKKARYYLYRSIKLYDSNTEPFRAAKVRCNLLKVLVEGRCFEEAFKFKDRILQGVDWNILPYRTILPAVYSNMAYFYLQSYREVSKLAAQGITIALGKHFDSSEDLLAKAKEYAEKSMELGKENLDNFQFSQILAQLADILYEEGDREKAIKFFDEALHYLSQTDARLKNRDLHFRVAGHLERMEQLELALQHYKSANFANY